jgi:electron transport complex protein RnfB
MDVVLILKAVGALSLIGVVSAILLGTAAQKFHVDVDPKVQRVLDALPGANCGACGNPSCFGAAEGIAEGRLLVTTCIAGGQEVADAVAEAMGQETCTVAAAVSCRHCGGGTNAKLAYEYGGVRSCNAVAKLAGGSTLCPSGCFGYGDCVQTCPFDAMTLDARGLPVIDPASCTGCGICVSECPRGKSGSLLELITVNAAVAVRCSSRDKIKSRRDYCTMSCIACKKCERACPSDAIHVVDMLAVVDYEKCTGCLACVAICPQNCIDVTGAASGRPVSVTDGAADSFSGFAPTVAVAALEEADGA